MKFQFLGFKIFTKWSVNVGTYVWNVAEKEKKYAWKIERRTFLKRHGHACTNYI